MTDTKKPRTARTPGFQANVALFIPVDKNSLKSQNEVSSALLAAEQAGDLSAVLGLPGVRLLAIKNARFAPIAADPAAAADEAGKEEGGEQIDIEDAIQAGAIGDTNVTIEGDSRDFEDAAENAIASGDTSEPIADDEAGTRNRQGRRRA